MIFGIKSKCPDLYNIFRTRLDLEKNQDLRTVIIGSSHLMYGWCGTGVNLSVSSQDLYNSYQLYKIANSKMQNLKNVVVSFSVFSYGYDLQRCNLSADCVAYKQFFGIPYQSQQLAAEKGFLELEPIVNKKVNKIMKHPLKLEKVTQKIFSARSKHNYKESVVRKRAEGHWKNCTRDKTQMQYFTGLLENTYQNGQNLIVVVTPAMKIYRDFLPQKQQIFEKVEKLCQKFPNVTLLNLYDSSEFLPDMFRDPDHLNTKGAKLLTEKINKFLK